MKIRKIALVGAGGIGCAIAPHLCRMANLVILDADHYEPENAKRQFPALTRTENKALVLKEALSSHALYDVFSIPAYVENIHIVTNPLMDDIDLIVGAVDNHASRRILADIGEELSIPVILAGNSHAHGEAHMLIPELYNPFHYFEFKDEEPPPWSCTHVKTLDEHPQTYIANVLAAGCALHLLHSYESAVNALNAMVYSRCDAFSGTYARAKDKISELAPK